MATNVYEVPVYENGKSEKAKKSCKKLLDSKKIIIGLVIALIVISTGLVLALLKILSQNKEMELLERFNLRRGRHHRPNHVGFLPPNTTKLPTMEKEMSNKCRNETKPIECKPPWHKGFESCYWFANLSVNFEEAERYCKAQNAQLFEIRSARKEEEMSRNFKEKRQGTEAWIGASHIRDNYKWHSDLKPVKEGYVHWLPPNPTRYIQGGIPEACMVAIKNQNTWQIGDIQCSGRTPPICERML